MRSGSKLRHTNDQTRESAVELVSPEFLDSKPVSLAVRYWGDLRAERCFPARGDLKPREMAPFLRNLVVIRIVDDGKDYEYRIVGDAFVQALGTNFRGLRLTEVEVADPAYGLATRAAYEHVRTTKQPFALRGWVSTSVPSLFSYHETVFLPLGDEGEIDHILVASSFTPRAIYGEEQQELGRVLPESWTSSI